MSGHVHVLDLRGVPPEQAELGEVARHIRAGGVAAYPTETVYGVGSVCTPEGVERVRALKSRGEDKPLIVLVRGVEELGDLVWTPGALELAEIFWPGAVTLVLPDPHHRFPRGIRSREGGVAARVSPHPLVVRLLDALGEPMTSTSANAPGAAPARSGSEAAEAVRGLGSGLDVWVVDGGTLPPSGPSTVVDCTGPRPVVVRKGSVPIERLRCALPGIEGR